MGQSGIGAALAAAALGLSACSAALRADWYFTSRADQRDSCADVQRVVPRAVCDEGELVPRADTWLQITNLDKVPHRVTSVSMNGEVLNSRDQTLQPGQVWLIHVAEFRSDRRSKDSRAICVAPVTVSASEDGRSPAELRGPPFRLDHLPRSWAVWCSDEPAERH